MKRRDKDATVRYSALILACCVLLAACGPPAQPPAPPAPPAQHAPTAAPVQAQTAEIAPAAATAAPSVTPLPRGKLLREVWPVAADGQPAVTALLYSDVQVDDTQERPAITYSFWQANLQDVTQQRKVADAPQTSPASGIPLPGELSPTGEYIAYLDVNQELASLHTIHIRSGKHRVVAEGLTPTNVRGLRQFAWSPDGNRVVFQKHWQDDQGFGKAYYVYTPGTTIDPVQVAQIGGADFIGWQDAATILVLRAMEGKRRLQLVSINVDTQTQKLIAEAPTTATVGFEELSPDQSRLLMSFRDGTYILSLKNKQYTKIDTVGPFTAWSADSRLVLALPNTKGRSAEVITIDRSQKPVLVNVFPADSTAYGHNVLSVSPDSQYLVTCESWAITDNQYRYRTMLYNIPDDQWTLLVEKDYCIKVLGWQ